MVILNNNRKTELLSPAGSYESFLNAVHYGADAVYLAGDKFGARAYAGNFSKDELLKALDFAHLYGKRVYMTVNTVLKDEELSGLFEYMRPFYESGLDGVIVQDMGVAALLKHYFPDMELHASTQMSITDVNGATLLKDYGFSRIVPARELSLDEIKNIILRTGIEIECFIHGAMCYSYSGKCLFSSFLGERSGNRGRCAQPCRLEYNGRYPLSMKDMYTLKILPDLLKAGIASFKIEGRMKSPDYVASVTSVYRKYIDMYYADPDGYHVDDEDERFLLDSYTRSGNCRGYYYQHNGKNMITLDSSAYNGEHSSEKIPDQYLEKLKVSGFASFFAGKRSELTLNYEDVYITEYGDIVDTALKNPTDEDTIRRQLNKTGSEELCFGELSITAEDNIFIPMGKLNSLRRNAIQSLKTEILKKHKRSYKEKEDFNTDDTSEEEPAKTKISLLIRDKKILKELLKISKPDEIIIPHDVLMALNAEDAELVKKLKAADEYGTHIILKLPFVMRRSSEAFEDALSDIVSKYNIRGIIASDYEELKLLSDIHYKGEIIAGEHLYCLNQKACRALRELGVNTTTVPLELNRNELLRRRVLGESLYVYGRIPLMISSGCVKNTLKGCDKKETLTYLKDRKNISFPVKNICSECTNIVYNSVPLFIDREDEVIKRLKPKRLIIAQTDEKEEFILKVLKYYQAGEKLPEFGYTRGHLNRGVL